MWIKIWDLEGEICWSPQGSISLARWLTTHGSPDVQHHLYSFSSLKFISPARPHCLYCCSYGHLKLTWTLNLLPKPSPSTAFSVSRATPSNQWPMGDTHPTVYHLYDTLWDEPYLFCLDFWKNFLTAFSVPNCKRKIFPLTALAKESWWYTSSGSNQLKLIKDCELWMTPRPDSC